MNLGEYTDTYQIIEKIGAGGGGTIYKAFHNRLQMYVVLKKIHESGSYDLAVVRREADILKNLRHSYLPQVLDFLILDSGVYTVMDFIPGHSLQELMDSGRHFSEKEIVKYGTQLCEALAYLHNQKPAIIHGDIKPSNIMITPQGNVCLIDFNISGVADTDNNAYVLGYSEGYAAPEQLQAYMQIRQSMNQKGAASSEANVEGKTELLNEETEILCDNTLETDYRTVILNENEEQKESTLRSGELAACESAEQPIKGIPVDTRSDVYSLAATLYHMLFGHKVVEENVKNTISHAGEGFCIILNKALNSNPEQRYQDADKMLSAFRNIYKLDKRYKRILLKQQFIELLFVLLGTVGIITAVRGYRKIESEKSDEYVSYVTELAYYRENGLQEEFAECYDAAVEMYPERLEAYYEQALYLYEKKEYKQAINYITTYILSDNTLCEAKGMADIYYLLGRDYFELEAYESASEAYRQAVQSEDSVNPNYYIEYAISLARIGKLEDAQQVLETAKGMDVSSDMIYLTQGELEKALENYESAYENFMSCISATSEDYTRLRAYIMCSELFDEKEVSADNYLAQIELLEKARMDLSLEYQAMILQRLAQAYINYGSLTGDNDANLSAIAVLEQIVNYGWGDFTTYSNIVVLYEKNGDLEAAGNVLDQIEEEYGNYYGFYKRWAFLEIDIQRQSEQDERDYSKFLEYYMTATQMYEDSNINTDTEMILLDDLYQQLEAGNWF